MQALYVWDKLNLVTLTLGADDLTRIATDLRPLATANPPEQGLTVFLPRPGPPLAEVVRSSLEWVDRRDGWRSLDRARDVLSGGTVESKVAWDDFAKRSAEYYTLLSQLVDLNLDEGQRRAACPSRLSPGARAALGRVLVQGFTAWIPVVRRSILTRPEAVIIGDEMGLGKTIQAIAVLAHLKATSATGRLLVVCPASVLVNWTREINERSALRVHRVHGFDRDWALKSWKKYGDVAVTTFDTLRAVDLEGRRFCNGRGR